MRAAAAGTDIIIRNPYSTRPFQHVLEPLFAYLMIAAEQTGHPELAGCYNVGPDEADCLHTGELADLFVKYWGGGMKWINRSDGGPHEANFLKLDCSKLKSTFGWRPRWHIDKAIEKTVEWSKCWLSGGDVRGMMSAQINEFLEAGKA